jgi:hypothetical protein
MTPSGADAQAVAIAVDRGARAGLLLELVRWYASDEMHDAMRCLKRSFDEVKRVGGLPEYYRTLVTGEEQNLEKAEELNGARRRVSHFFLAAMTLCKHGFLDEALAANVLGPDAISFFLDVVEPLDQMHRRVRVKRPENHAAREFYVRLDQLSDTMQ